MRGYSLIIGRLLCFTMRCHRGQPRTYNMKLDQAQQRSCESLHDVLSAYTDGSDGKVDSIDEQDWYSALELGDEPLDDPDSEVYDELDDPSVDDVGDSPSAELGAATWHRIAENPIQACILDLLVSLFTQLPTGRDDKFFSPILRFAVLFSLRKNGQWLPPRRITRLLAVLLFCGREVMMSLMYRRLLEDPTMRYSKYVA
jgi:hypothetical protein